MKSVHVFYRLKNDQYHLQFEGKTAFVEKEKWNAFIKEQHNHKEGVSLSGGISIELEELERQLSK
ncbi:hypothetical protein [Halalkalibacter alkalisediminis]|uniref:Uncharacterized protein n=1 Tax=Halalkalibacter alkalisediminis TaxID=935616 RepID=A0ABV6NKY9_9BACI